MKLFELLFVLVLIVGCNEPKKQEPIADYSTIENVLRNSCEAVSGEYLDSIPDNFNNDSLFSILKRTDRMYEYNEIRKFKFTIEPHTTYYLIKVYDNNKLIMFDYSNTPAVDGPVYRGDAKYDINKVPSN